jgi:hypothetical protein
MWQRCGQVLSRLTKLRQAFGNRMRAQKLVVKARVGNSPYTVASNHNLRNYQTCLILGMFHSGPGR